MLSKKKIILVRNTVKERQNRLDWLLCNRCFHLSSIRYQQNFYQSIDFNHLMMNNIERLPDEILLDLFENYIRLIDIYLIFRPLKHDRISSILESCSFKIDIPSKDIFHHDSFLFYSSKIVSLNICCFSPDLDLSKFIHLRSLHLEKPTREQLLAIRADYLPNLEYLSLYRCWYSFQELPTTLTTMIKSSHFKYLRYFICPDGKVISLFSDRSCSINDDPNSHQV